MDLAFALVTKRWLSRLMKVILLVEATSLMIESILQQSFFAIYQ